MILLRMTLVSFFAVILMFRGICYGETFYEWVDDKGVTHVTNTYESIPAKYRSQIKSMEIENPPPSPTKKPTRTRKVSPPRPRLSSPTLLPPAGGEPEREAAPPSELSPIQKEKESVEKELALAREAQEILKKFEFEYLRPDFVNKYLTKEDLQKLPRYGYLRGVPRVKRENVFYYNRKKIQELESRLEDINDRIGKERP